MIINRFSTIIALLFVAFSSFAQPAPVKKAAKSMFKLTTFAQDGSILKNGYGVFTSAEGDAISSWEPFIGAYSACVIDGQGRKYDVDCLIGANEIYNQAKFRVIVPEGKKMAIVPFVIAEQQLETGGKCWFVSYDVKSPAIRQHATSKVETFASSLPYYIFEDGESEELAGSPFLNDAGELLGIMQPAKRRTDMYCPSAKYAIEMSVSGFTANEPTLRQTFMRTALPTDYNQAVLALMMANSRFNSPTYLSTAEEFIGRFPTAIDGYNAKATYLVSQDKLLDAENAMNECIEKCEAKDDAHYTFSRIIYNKVAYPTDTVEVAWTLDKSLQEVNLAIALNSQPIYIMHRAKIFFAQQKYEEAYSDFISLTETNFRNAEVFNYASICQRQLQAPDSVITALLDSAIACFATPYPKDAAPHLLVRARWFESIGQFRKAVNDYNQYEALMQKLLNANFYYIKEQAELQAKMYQAALDDIDKAIELDPNDGTYLIEKALLLFRVNHIEEGLKVSERSITLFPEYGDAFAIHGLGLILSGNKTEGRRMLDKAKELESELADGFIEKYF